MDYKIDAIKLLLNEDCILSRYFPLIPYKVQIIEFAKKSNIKTKNELSKMDTINIFNDESLNNLFVKMLNHIQLLQVIQLELLEKDLMMNLLTY